MNSLEITKTEAQLILNNFSDKTISLCESCPMFGNMECDKDCIADKLVSKIQNLNFKEK